ncbi:hypothetical protein R6Q57_017148 [Mikania cordata]
MVCIRNDLKVQTQELNLASNGSYRESVKLQIGDTSSVFRSKIKSFKEQTEVEDGEFATTLRKEESLSRDNCTWLSISGASSPSSCSKDDGLSSCMDLKIDAWFISLLSTQSPSSGSLLNTMITFFDGSRVNPIEEASLVLYQRKKSDENMVFQENVEEEDVVLWLKNETFDDGLECYSQTLKKRSKSKSNSSYFTDSSDEQSLLSSSSSSDYSSEVLDLGEANIDKPLFWSLNSASDWSSETEWDYFIMSPRKDIYKGGKSPKTTNNLCPKVPNQELDTEKGCNRRLVFETHLQSSDTCDLNNNEDEYVASEDTKIKTPVFWLPNCASEWNFDSKWDFLTISPRNDVCYKFGNSQKTCLKSHGNKDLENGCNRRLEFSRDSKSSSNMMQSTGIQATEQTRADRLPKRSVSKYKIVLEDLLLVDKLNAEGVIEQVLGLGEFDGHEGIESEFDKDEFSPLF